MRMHGDRPSWPTLHRPAGFWPAAAGACLAFAGGLANAAQVLFVVGSTTLNSGDTAVFNRLANQGHVVTVVSDTASATGDSAGKSLVLISSTCTSGSVNTKFRDVAVPVVVWESALFDDMRMTGAASGTDFGTQASQSQLAVVAGSPLSGTLGGTVTVTTSAQTFVWGAPNPATALVSARLTGNGNPAALFCYKSGDLMVGQGAPGPRTGLFLENLAAAALNANGWVLFDAAVHWSLNQQPTGAGDLPQFGEAIGPSSRRTGLVFSELMYHPADRIDGLDTEFIEIHNAEPFTRDIGGYRLEGEIGFAFPEGTTLAPHAYVVVARTPADLEAAAGITGVLGPYTGSLGNDGGDLRLLHAQGAVLLELQYDDERPWPKAPDGAGPSLALAAPSRGEADPRAWAASSRIGGTPGVEEDWPEDPLSGLVINEILSHTSLPDWDFLELYNHSGETLDVSGVQLSNHPTSNRYVIAEGTMIDPGRSIQFSEFQLGFAFPPTGGTGYVFNVDGTRVVDAQEFGASEAGVSQGRYPDGAANFQALELPTPGDGNLAPQAHPVVINEIMYHPLSQDRDDEYLELHNSGVDAVDLSDWRLRGGVDYVFAPGTFLSPDGYLVITRNRARFLSRYPAVDPSRVVGDFSGSLSDRGERLVLERPQFPGLPVYFLVDEVTYADGGTWGEWSDGGGSSLELVDPRADNDLAANWADSDETAKAPWTPISATGVLDHGTGTPNELQVLTLDAAHIVVDKVSVRKSTDSAGSNRVPNGDFESNLTGWVIQGNHEGSFRDTTQGAAGSASSLRLVAPGDGDNGVNRAEIDLSPALAANDTATISAQARWLRGHTNLLFRLKGNYLEAVGQLTVPSHLGTPGAANSRRVDNAAPSITEVTHRPTLPSALGEVTITARVLDPDPLLAVNLKYRIDPSASVTTVAMSDNGAGADEVAGDGIYSAKIPGQATGVTAAYTLEATDYHPNAAVRRYPADAPAREALVRWGETVVPGDFAAYRFWTTAANLSLWESRQKLSNALIPGTFVYADTRVVHGAGARYRGSPWIRPSYSSPISGRLANLVFSMPSDDRVLGITAFNVDAMEQDVRDGSLQRERMAFWLAERMGAPVIHQRFFTLHINGVRLGQVYQDSQQPNGDYLECWFPGADDGEFFEIDDWFEFNDTVEREYSADAALADYTTTGGARKRARYRWSWQQKNTGATPDTPTALYSLVDTFNLADNQAFLDAVRETVDVTSWFRDFAVRRALGDWDGYGFNRGKNTFLYRPPGGTWKLLLWDLDFTTGAGSRNYDQPLFDQIQDPVLARFHTLDPLERIYWAMLKRAAEGPMAASAYNAISDELHSVFLANGLTPSSPATAQTWVANRRSYILAQLASVNASFAITTNGGADFSTADSPVTLSGTAPVEAVELLVNGVPLAVQWTSVTAWTATLYLQPGANILNLSANDLDGRPVPALAGSVTVTLTGGGAPLLGNLAITEIMYHPADTPPHLDTDLEFIELKNLGTQTLDLDGVGFSAGVTYTFPAGTQLAPGAFLVLASSIPALGAVYPWISPAGEYDGQLSNSGEVLTLRDALGNVITSIPFDDAAPWPSSPDGSGTSLVPVNPNPPQPQDGAGSWRASAWLGGSPGQDDPELVIGPPVILAQPTGMVVEVGQSAAFLCLATGYPQPYYQWQRQGVDIPGANGPRLLLASAQAGDNGALYRCVVANGVGTVISDTALLVVPTLHPVARVTDRLVAYYPFNERSGTTTADRSGFGTPLNLGFSGGGITWLPGLNGVKIASNSSILSGAAATKVHNALQSSRQMTIELWAKPANTTQSGPARMFGVSTDTGNRNYGLVQSAGNLDFRLRTTSTGNNGASPATTASGVMSTAQPMHFAATYTQGGATQVYINGVPTASITPGGNIGNWNAAYRMILANEITGDRPWLGEMYLAAIYDGALSAAQIQQNRDAGHQPNPGAGVPPVITFSPANQSLQCRNLLPVAATQEVAVAWNCSPSGVVVAVDTDLGGAGCAADPGLIRRVFTAIDQCGLLAVSTQLFTVVDTTGPVVTCPPASSVNISGSGCAAPAPDLRYLATVADGCDAGAAAVTQSPAPGTSLAAGTHTVTLTARDACGNLGSCQVSVQVRDVTPPSVICPPPIVRTAGAMCTTIVPRINPVVSDSCTPSAQILVTQVPAVGASVGAGSHVITVTATDAAGNSSQCATTLVVNDTVPPLITCPGAVTLDAGAGCQAGLPAFSALSASDVCGPVTVTQSPVAGTLVGLGNTTVTLTARDAAGNTAACTVVVTVRDATAPGIVCPPPLVLEVTTGCSTPLPALVAQVSDNCTPAGDLVVDQSPVAGTSLPVGTHAVQLAVRDAAGNTNACVVQVDVRDTQPPVLLGILPTRILQCESQLPTPIPPPFADNCDPDVVVTLQRLEQISPISCARAVAFVWTAVDDSGNRLRVHQRYQIQDRIKPVIESCPPGGTAASLAEVPPPAPQSVVATDNCGPDLVVRVVSTNVVQEAGCQVRVDYLYAVTDICGNSSTCTESWAVTHSGPPVFATEPADATFTGGGSVTLEAMAVGCSAPVYQWLRDGEPLPGESGPTLVLDNLGALDNGTQVQCVATNLEGTVSSRIATLLLVPAALGAAAPEDLRITGDPSSAGLEVSLDSQLSMIYRLQKTLSLEKPDWRNCGPALRGTNDPLLLPEPAPGGERGYYRVLAWPSPPP